MGRGVRAAISVPFFSSFETSWCTMGRSNLPVGRHCDVEADSAICCWVLEKLDSEGKCSVKALRQAKHIGNRRAVRLIANCMEAREEEASEKSTSDPFATPSKVSEGILSISPASDPSGPELKLRSVENGDILDSARPVMLRD